MWYLQVCRYLQNSFLSISSVLIVKRLRKNDQNTSILWQIRLSIKNFDTFLSHWDKFKKRVFSVPNWRGMTGDTCKIACITLTFATGTGSFSWTDWTASTSQTDCMAGLDGWTDWLAGLAGWTGWTDWQDWLDLFYWLDWLDLDWQAGLIEWLNMLVGLSGLTGWLNWLVLIGWTCFTNICYWHWESGTVCIDWMTNKLQTMYSHYRRRKSREELASTTVRWQECLNWLVLLN